MTDKQTRKSSRLSLIALREDLLDDVSFSTVRLENGSIATVALAEDENGAIHYGLTFCKPTDQFSRPFGQDRAFESFHYGKNRSGVVSPEEQDELTKRTPLKMARLAVKNELLVSTPHWYTA